MHYKVVFRRNAITDLIDMERYIEERSDASRAYAYTDRVEAYCKGLATFPERGRQSNHILTGLRLTTFDRSVTIAYRIVDIEVMILRILGPGRDIVAELLRSD